MGRSQWSKGLRISQYKRRDYFSTHLDSSICTFLCWRIHLLCLPYPSELLVQFSFVCSPVNRTFEKTLRRSQCTRTYTMLKNPYRLTIYHRPGIHFRKEEEMYWIKSLCDLDNHIDICNRLMCVLSLLLAECLARLHTNNDTSGLKQVTNQLKKLKTWESIIHNRIHKRIDVLFDKVKTHFWKDQIISEVSFAN